MTHCNVLPPAFGNLAHRSVPQSVGLFKDVTPEGDEIPKSLRGYDIKESAWSVLYNGKMTQLSVLNDAKRLSFKQIADIIEKQVPTHRS